MKKILRIFFLIICIYLSFVFYRSYTFIKTDLYRFNPGYRDNLRYYLDFKDNVNEWPTDSSGVFLADYSKSTHRFLNNKHYNPTNIAIGALSCWNMYIMQKDSISRSVFLIQADWLCRNYYKEGKMRGGIPYMFDHMELKAPWLSALAQGLALSVFSRAYRLTGDNKYRIAMKEVFLPFTRAIRDGGVASFFHGAFFEEFPAPSNRRILNGFIYSLLGIYDYWNENKDTAAYMLYRNGISTLEKILPEYDTRHWSLYALPVQSVISNHFRYASPKYHVLHVDLLHALYSVSGIRTFRFFGDRFKKYYDDGYMKWIIVPSYIVFKDIMYLKKRLS